MKKILLILTLVLGIGLMASFAYAQGPTVSNTRPVTTPGVNVDKEQWETWYQERMEWKEAQLEQALKDKLITEEEFKVWNEYFKLMKEFHSENGFMPGICQGGYGWSNGNGLNRGFGQGMMRGNRWNR